MFKIKYTDEVIVNETGLQIVWKILNDTNFRLYINNKAEIKNSSSVTQTCYWNEKYYRNGFVDGVQMIMGCVEE